MTETVRLGGGPEAGWELTVRQRGGRITSLRHGGRELLDQGIGVDSAGTEDFVAAGAWGWDEMVPNIEAAGGLPDHGEAWRLRWEVIDADRTSCRMRCRGQVVGWELERRLVLAGDVIRAEYRYTNRSAGPQHAYWAAHPLFKFEPGMEVGVRGCERLGALPAGASAKIRLEKGAFDTAHLRWRRGAGGVHGVQMSWDRNLTPYVAVWACNGDLGGSRQIAIEPATGGNDRPDPSAPPPLLEPGESTAWWLEIRAL